MPFSPLPHTSTSSAPPSPFLYISQSPLSHISLEPSQIYYSASIFTPSHPDTFPSTSFSYLSIVTSSSFAPLFLTSPLFHLTHIRTSPLHSLTSTAPLSSNCHIFPSLPSPFTPAAPAFHQSLPHLHPHISHLFPHLSPFPSVSLPPHIPHISPFLTHLSSLSSASPPSQPSHTLLTHPPSLFLHLPSSYPSLTHTLHISSPFPHLLCCPFIHTSLTSPPFDLTLAPSHYFSSLHTPSTLGKAQDSVRNLYLPPQAPLTLLKHSQHDISSPKRCPTRLTRLPAHPPPPPPVNATNYLFLPYTLSVCGVRFKMARVREGTGCGV